MSRTHPEALRPSPGERHGMARLTAAQVLEMRASRDPQKALAWQYEISVQHVSDILNRRRWRHI